GSGAGVPLHLAGDGACRFPGRHPRRDHRQGPQPALAPCGARGRRRGRGGQDARAARAGRTGIRGGQTMKIGFIGLGNMGAPMARNLVAAGHDVTGYDTAAPMPDGVHAAISAAGAAKGAEVVITMLPNGAILRAIADEVIPAMMTGAVLCDCSTVDVESARAVAAQAGAAGLLALDAPVSGGVGGASAGTLTFM